jgi:diphosphomevalonate decarboxylase
MDTGMYATARAQPNIALIKYWGKRDTGRNLPAVDSLSLTLCDLYTEMEVCFNAGLAADSLHVNGERDDGLLPRVVQCLDAVAGRDRAAATVRSTCNFPLGAGLASSASAFAALVVAAAAAGGLDLDRPSLACLAGGVSGSAARSLYSGIVLLTNEKDRVRAESLLAPSEWPLRVVIAITEPARKTTGSGPAMESSRATSPFYARWIEEQARDLEEALAAIAARDFAALGHVAEHNCLKMHSVMWSSRPALCYWNAATVSCLHAVRRLQAEGADVFFTIDAGPQVKAVCTSSSEADVRRALEAVDGVRDVLVSGLGEGARLAGMPA